MGANTVDWNAVRTTYVTSTKSYRQIAKEHGISASLAQKRGKAEGWPVQRLKFQREAAERAIAAEVDNEANRLGCILRAANAMSRVIEGIYADPDQFYRHLVQVTCSGDGETVERIYRKADTRAIKDLTGALKDMTWVLRNLNNLPTQAEAEAQRIAAERLNMDKRRFEVESGADKSIKVVLADGWEELAK